MTNWFTDVSEWSSSLLSGVGHSLAERLLPNVHLDDLDAVEYFGEQ